MAWLGPKIGKPRGWERVVRRIVPFEACAGLPQKWIRREGTVFLSKPSVPIGYNVTFFGTYEAGLRALMRRKLTPGSVAVDIGANVGWHTMLMARLVGNKGRVFAVEANPSVRERLELHLQANHLANATIVPSAMGHCAGKLRFLAPPVDSIGAGDGHVAGPEDALHVVETDVTTLDELVERESLGRLDFVKIDVEGFEWPVLQGGVQALARFRPVICFEFNSVYTGRGEGTSAELQQFFNRLEYDLAVMARGGLRPLSDDAWPDCANLVATPRGAAKSLAAVTSDE